MATKIVVNRKSELFNRRRGIKINIDGAEIGQVANGSSEEYQVPPGMHTMQCKINWCSSPELTLHVNEGEMKFLKVRSAARYYMPLYFLALLAVVSRLLLKLANIPPPENISLYQLIFIMPFLLYALYYLTIARHRYLLLEEDKENIFN